MDFLQECTRGRESQFHGVVVVQTFFRVRCIAVESYLVFRTCITIEARYPLNLFTKPLLL